jgi:hypothetical protein
LASVHGKQHYGRVVLVCVVLMKGTSVRISVQSKGQLPSPIILVSDFCSRYCGVPVHFTPGMSVSWQFVCASVRFFRKRKQVKDPSYTERFLYVSRLIPL